MALQQNEDVKWYLLTRKEGGAHSVRNENYVAIYEREYERIREFDTIEEAKEALEVRIQADPKATGAKDQGKIKAAKIRGDITKGSVEDEDTRAAVRAEIMEELKKEGALKPPSSEATVGPKTRKRTTAAKK